MKRVIGLNFKNAFTLLAAISSCGLTLPDKVTVKFKKEIEYEGSTDYYGMASGKAVVMLSERCIVDGMQLSCLYHELKHIEQFHTGRLKTTKDKFIWQGMDLTDLPYDKTPWEIEANEYEARMVS